MALNGEKGKINFFRKKIAELKKKFWKYKNNNYLCIRKAVPNRPDGFPETEITNSYGNAQIHYEANQ